VNGNVREPAMHIMPLLGGHKKYLNGKKTNTSTHTISGAIKKNSMTVNAFSDSIVN
jgi:hypothetical protein